MKKCSVKAVSAKGFTLLELLLVITIISVLMSVVAPKFFGRSKEAKIAAAKQMISGSFRLALALFEQDVGRYPNNNEGLEALVQNPRINSWKGPYLESMVIPPDPWGNQYSYSYPSVITASETLYDIISGGPDGIMGNEDDVTNHYEYTR